MSKLFEIEDGEVLISDDPYSFTVPIAEFCEKVKAILDEIENS